MSVDPGYMLIRVELQGAQKAAAEAAGLGTAITGVGEAATASSVASSAAATKSAKSTAKISKFWSMAGKAAKFGALGIAGAAAGITALGISSVEKIKDLGLVAAGLRRNLDLTAEAGSRWASVAEARGIAPTSLNMGFKTLSQNLTMANKEGGTYMDNLQLIGLTHEDVSHGVEDFNWFIGQTAKRFGEMEGSAKRQTAAAKLLGRGYQTILPLFSDGNKSLEESLGWADKYHVAFGDKMVDDTVALAQAQRESKVAWLGIQSALAKTFMPVLMDVHKEWQEFAEDLTDPSLTDDQRIDLIAEKFEEISRKAGKLIAGIIPVAVENMAENAPRVAVAFAQGFLQADVWGRIVAGLWLSKYLLGLKPIASKAGGSVGRSFMLGFITLGLVTIGPEVFKWAKELGEKFKDWGYEFGYNIGTKMADVLNFFIEQFNQSFASDLVGDIGTIEGEYQPPSLYTDQGLPHGDTLDDIVNDQGFGIFPPGSVPDPSFPGGGGGGGGQGGGGKRASGERPQGKTSSRDREWTSSSDVILDGEKIGKVIHKHAAAAAARR